MHLLLFYFQEMWHLLFVISKAVCVSLWKWIKKVVNLRLQSLEDKSMPWDFNTESSLEHNTKGSAQGYFLFTCEQVWNTLYIQHGTDNLVIDLGLLQGYSCTHLWSKNHLRIISEHSFKILNLPTYLRACEDMFDRLVIKMTAETISGDLISIGKYNPRIHVLIHAYFTQSSSCLLNLNFFFRLR